MKPMKFFRNLILRGIDFNCNFYWTIEQLIGSGHREKYYVWTLGAYFRELL